MHSTGKGKQISQKFSQTLSQYLCYWSIIIFSDLPLKGASSKLPLLNAGILGVLRFSYNLKLVSQYKILSCSTGKESIPWTGSSAQLLWTFSTLRAGDVCMCVSIPSQLSFLCCTESLSPLTKPFWLSSLFEVHRVNQHSMVHKFSFQISPEAGDSFPWLYFCLQCGKQNFPVMQFQLHIRALLGKHRARAVTLECLKGAIQRHHSPSVQATNAHVKAVMEHPPNPREGAHKDTFLILHSVTSCRAHIAAELRL